MCDFEEFLFDCRHSEIRLKSWCHFARNEPNHRCHGVKVLRNTWPQLRLCDPCELARLRWMEKQIRQKNEQEQKD